MTTCLAADWLPLTKFESEMAPLHIRPRLVASILSSSPRSRLPPLYRSAMCSTHNGLSNEIGNFPLDLNEQCKHSTVFDNIFADRLTNDFTSHLQLNRPFRSLSPSYPPRPPLPPHPRSVLRYRLLHRHRPPTDFQTMLKRVRARTRGSKRELEDDSDLA